MMHDTALEGDGDRAGNREGERSGLGDRAALVKPPSGNPPAGDMVNAFHSDALGPITTYAIE